MIHYTIVSVDGVFLPVCRSGLAYFAAQDSANADDSSEFAPQADLSAYINSSPIL